MWAFILDCVINGESAFDLAHFGSLHFMLSVRYESGSFVIVRFSEYRIFLDELGLEGVRKLFLEEFRNLIVCILDDTTKIGLSFFKVLEERVIPRVYRRSFGRLHFWVSDWFFGVGNNSNFDLISFGRHYWKV